MATYGDPAIVKSRVVLGFADLGFADQPAYDAFLTSMNERASQLVIDETGRDFDLHAADAIVLDGTDGPDLLLPGYPIVSVASVTEGGEVVAATDYRIKRSEAGAPNSGILQRKPPSLWAEVWGSIAITYTWGYATPPASIRAVVENLMVRLVQGRLAGSKAPGATSISMDGFSVAYDKDMLRALLSDDDRLVLDRYRRILVA